MFAPSARSRLHTVIVAAERLQNDRTFAIVVSADEMHELLMLALDVLRPERVWANPDCGLKTRG